MTGFAHDHSPHGEQQIFEEFQLRYFKKVNSYRFLTEFKVRNSFDNTLEHHLKLALNRRVLKGLKIGAIYQIQKNERHNDDWEFFSRKKWFWKNHKDYYENIFGGFLTARYLLSTLWMTEFRVQYEVNSSNGHQLLKLRPGLQYFWLRNGSPLVNIFLRYEHYLPLNFGDYQMFQSWVYLGSLFHINKQNKVSIHTSIGGWNWSTSREARLKLPAEPYSVREEAQVFGLTYIYTH